MTKNKKKKTPPTLPYKTGRRYYRVSSTHYAYKQHLRQIRKIKDNASSELLRIRRELASTAGSISRSLNAILRNAQAEGYVDKDVTPTMRDGRLVIPVAPGLKRKIKGIVHDESSTGKTVFIEPAEVVEANNRIRELEGEERREIIRILTDFSIIIRPQVPAILQSYEFLAEIDFIRAKAHFPFRRTPPNHHWKTNRFWTGPWPYTHYCNSRWPSIIKGCSSRYRTN